MALPYLKIIRVLQNLKINSLNIETNRVILYGPIVNTQYEILLIPCVYLKRYTRHFVVQIDYCVAVDGKVNFNKVEKGVF